MASRPSFNRPIDDLETSYREHGSDTDVCNNILVELGFRNTQRALKLRGKLAGETAGKSHTGGLSAPFQKKAAKETSVPPVTSSSVTSPPLTPPPVIARPEGIAPPRSAPGPKPAVTNDPQSILRAWTALEVLSPQGYRRETDLAGGDRSRIAWLDEGALPWEAGEKSRPGQRLFYELILGTIELGPAVESLLKLYANDRTRRPFGRNHPLRASFSTRTDAPWKRTRALRSRALPGGFRLPYRGT